MPNAKKSTKTSAHVSAGAPDGMGADQGRDVAATLSLGRSENDIGERIKEAREKRGWSQESASRLSKQFDPDRKGISRSVLAYYEKGRFRPGARELRILYRTLGVTPNWLVLGESDPNRLSEFRQRFKTDEAFYDALLIAIKKLDSDTLSAVARLVFVASSDEKDVKKLEGTLTEFGKLAYGLLDDLSARHEALDATARRITGAKKGTRGKTR